MERQLDLDSWDDFERELRTISPQVQATGQIGTSSQLLFRGQATWGWRLETTLERAGTKIKTIADYFQFLAGAKPQLETFTGQRWPEFSLAEIRKAYETYDNFFLAQFPSYELCVYSRHHGFPSPLLDWSRSPYIAAFFAFQAPVAERIAIWAYQEYVGVGKVSSSNEPQIKNLGPYVTSHPRHFLQQGQYTLAARFEDSQWHLAGHHSVFELGREHQDRLIKFTLPASERDKVLRILDLYNINSYSLLQTDDALLETIAFRLLPRYR